MLFSSNQTKRKLDKKNSDKIWVQTKECNEAHILPKTLCKKNFDLGKAVGRNVA